MKRKVSRIGPCTLMVSLPSKWTKKFGVKKGDEIELKELNNTLVLSKDMQKQKGQCMNIHITSKSVIRAILSNPYAKGYDLVKIEYDEPNLMLEIQKVVDDLLGYEIIDKTEKYCIVKNFAEGIEGEYENLLRKSFLLTLSIMDKTIEDMKKNSYKNLEEIEQIENMIVRFTNLCKRTINQEKRGYDELCFYYNLPYLLEKTSKEVIYLYRYLNKKNIKINKEVINLYIKVKEMFNYFYEGFYIKEAKNMDKVSDLKNELLSEVYELFLKISPKEGPVLLHIGGVIRMIFNLTGTYYGIYY